jgi:hypothetical protein
VHAPPGHALVWKDRGVANLSGDGRHAYEAQAGQGTYCIVAATEPLSMAFAGYSVVHRPTGKIIDGQRRLSSGVKTIEEAKAIAQADHDEGNDARP